MSLNMKDKEDHRGWKGENNECPKVLVDKTLKSLPVFYT